MMSIEDTCKNFTKVCQNAQKLTSAKLWTKILAKEIWLQCIMPMRELMGTHILNIIGTGLAMFANYLWVHHTPDGG